MTGLTKGLGGDMEVGGMDMEEVKEAYEVVKRMDVLDVSVEGMEIWVTAENAYHDNERVPRVENQIYLRMRSEMPDGRNFPYAITHVPATFTRFPFVSVSSSWLEGLLLKPRVSTNPRPSSHHNMDKTKDKTTRMLKKIKSKLFHRTGKDHDDSDDDAAGSGAKSESEAQAEAILAFRTITMMLSMIQSPTTEIRVEEIPKTDVERRQLRVLDALSAVAVRQHEIVAVMAKSYDGDGLQVLASVNNLDPTLDITQHKESRQGGGPLRLKWWITPNPRPKAKNPKDKVDSLTRTTLNKSVTLVDPNLKISGYLSKAPPDKLLDTFLQTEWGNESFDTHIWMLKTFLGRSRSSDGLKTLQLYSIAASFRKMLSRMENRRIAKTYLNCLTNLKSRTFEFIEPPHIETTRSSDRHPDQTFLDHLPSLAVFMDLPNLTAAKAMGKSCEIYNKKTCIEFHKLLCELLIHFHKSLTALRALKETMVNVREELRVAQEKLRVAQESEELRVAQEVTSSKANDDLEKLGNELEFARVKMVSTLEGIRTGLDDTLSFGLSLRAIVTGAAIEKHLKAIAHLLVVDDGKSVGTQEDANPTEEDTEFDALKPYSMQHGAPLQPWQSYKDWLRLTVIYFDAWYILSGYLKKIVPTPTNSIVIDIMILAPSLPPTTMLPWKKLLKHKVYFPELPEDPEQPSAEVLINFLSSNFDAAQEATLNETGEMVSVRGKERKGEESVSIEGVLISVRKLKNDQESAIANNSVADLMPGLNQGIDSVVNDMFLLKNCLSSSGAQFANTIRLQLMDLKRDHLTPELRLTETQDIVEMIVTLKGHSLLFQELKKDPLTYGKDFPGVRHCEVFIGSFCRLSESDLEAFDLDGNKATARQFIENGPAIGTIGVSKRCCPVCARLLELMKRSDKHKFIITGRHSTITPCTLPEWLPADIIKKMTVEFGGRLRRELVKLQKGTEDLRQRTFSTDTRRISQESLSSAIMVDNEFLRGNLKRWAITEG